MSDLISRQAVIKALHSYFGDGFEEDKWWNSTHVLTAIKEIPSAQPEPCVDTIDALNESIKRFDDMAEECRRNANIERNDYMDMRDNAAEYRQLSIWLNELKWLRERFQSQTEIIHCRECKHWKQQTNYAGAPLSFGFCESDDMWRSLYGEIYEVAHINTDDDFYCGFAERRTDG